jgi:NAD(P)H dehydrogenase (quinone)
MRTGRGGGQPSLYHHAGEEIGRIANLSEASLRCASCGAVWITGAPQTLLERGEGCLRCGGTLVPSEVGAEPEARRPFAITGTAGPIGERIAGRLAALGVAQRLIVRDAASAPNLAGADVAEASYDDTRAMVRALEGMQSLLLVAAEESPDLAEQHVAAVDAASSAGVERIVYVSILAARSDATHTVARDHFKAEERTRAAGLDYTFLRPSYYLDVLPSLCSADGVIRNPAGDGRVACVSHDDMAEVAVVVLTESDHDGRTYDVTGPQALTMTDIARELAGAAGRDITYVRQTLDEARAARTGNGEGDWENEFWITYFAAIASGEMDVMSDTVVRLTDHEPQTLAGHLREHPDAASG